MLQAQAPANLAGTRLEQFVPEHIWMHTDRQLYVSGETIWFKIYNFDTEKQTLSNFSKVAYLEMINQQGSATSRIKVGLKNGTGQGSIELPEQSDHSVHIMHAPKAQIERRFAHHPVHDR